MGNARLLVDYAARNEAAITSPVIDDTSLKPFTASMNDGACEMDRRSILKSAALATAALGATSAPAAADVQRPAGFIQTSDAAQLFYRDWGTGKPVVFINAWAVSTDIWEYLMIRLVD